MTHCIPNTWGVWYAPVSACAKEQQAVAYTRRSLVESLPRPSSYIRNEHTEKMISDAPEKMWV
jgi:hypothetical protein